VLYRDALRGLLFTLLVPVDLMLRLCAVPQFEGRRAHLAGVVSGQSLIAGVDQDFHVRVGVEQRVDAFDPDCG
jgi:hypothetical protein